MYTKREIKQFGAEFLGTLFFISVILYSGNAYMIGLALVIAIVIAGPISGGHFNPAVTLTKYAQREIHKSQMLYYIVAQCLAGLVALSTIRM